MLTYTNLYRHYSLAVLAAVALCWTVPAHGQVGLGLTPMREELQLSRGATYSGVLTIVNETTEKTRVVAELLDFYIDEATNPQFRGQLPRETEFSCRSWLTLNPMDFELPASSQMQIRYTVRAPAEATDRSYHCAMGFTTQPTAAQLKGTGLRTAVQIVSALYVVVGKPVAEGTLKDLKLEYVAGPKAPVWQAVVTMTNPSLMHYRPTGSLDVLNEAGVVVENVKFVPLPVLPKRDQIFVMPLKLASGPGSYTLRARVDLGGAEIQEATARVTAEKK